jgi:hypothetical protein
MDPVSFSKAVAWNRGTVTATAIVPFRCSKKGDHPNFMVFPQYQRTGNLWKFLRQVMFQIPFWD